MDDDALFDVLQDIGLTEYQSRAYVAAVSLGSTRFSALSEESDIPQQRIYDVVEDLEGMGLVEVHEGTEGKEAIAVQPETGLTELKQQRFDEFASNVDTAVTSLEQRHEQADTSLGFVTVVNHETSVERHVVSAIEDAEWWLFLSLDYDWYRDLESDVRRAIDRGVTVRLLVQSEDDQAVANATYPEGMEVRYRPSADLVVAADRDYGVFRGIAAPSMTRPSLVTWDENMVEMLQRYTEQFWLPSRHVYGERPFPRRYLTPWLAIADLEDLLAADEELSVYVEGRDTTTGREGAWEGRIVDVETRAGGGLESRLGLPEVARMTVDTGDGQVTLGGWDATLEDVAANGLEIRRG